MPDHGAALRQVAQFLEEVGLAKFGSCGLLACTAWCTAACALLSTGIHGAALSQVARFLEQAVLLSTTVSRISQVCSA